MGPIDYGIAAPVDPTDAFNAALQQSLQMRQAQAQQQQQQAINNALTALANNPNATASDYARVATLAPGLSEHLKRAADLLSADQQQAELMHNSQALSAAMSGRPDVAQQLLERRAKAYENSGRPEDATLPRAIAAQLDSDPHRAIAGLSALVSSFKDGDKVIAGLGQFGAESRAQQLQPSALKKADAEATTAGATAQYALPMAGVKLGEAQSDATVKRVDAANAATKAGLGNANVQSEIETRAGQIRLEALKAGQLPESAVTLVNTATTDAAKAEQQVGQMHELAGRVEALGTGWGKVGSAGEWFKSAFGNEDAVTAVKREATRLINSRAVMMLPPGPASNADIAMVKDGFLSPNANPETLAAGMRALARLSAIDAAFNSAKAEWVGEVRSQTKAPRDIEIDGVKIPAGTTFPEFVRKYVPGKADSLNNAAQLGTRGYMKYANPQTPTGTTGTSGTY